MACKPLPQFEALHKALRYDPETGLLYWRWRDDIAMHRNKLFAGKEAFTALSTHGYRRGILMGVSYMAHRVIWKMIYGEEPEVIDHIDGNPENNRVENLRSVSATENKRNARRRKDNSCGVTGVCWNKRQKKWCARINKKSLGAFDKLEDAAAARRIAERDLGFHENHGRH